MTNFYSSLVYFVTVAASLVLARHTHRIARGLVNPWLISPYRQFINWNGASPVAESPTPPLALTTSTSNTSATSSPSPLAVGSKPKPGHLGFDLSATLLPHLLRNYAGPERPKQLQAMFSPSAPATARPILPREFAKQSKTDEPETTGLEVVVNEDAKKNSEPRYTFTECAYNPISCDW